MLVTGVQAAGAKGLTAIQGVVVDVKAATRTMLEGDGDRDRAEVSRLRPREPQPVVFHRAGIAMDQRPVAMRRQHAQTRYREDGGDDAA